MMRGVAKCHEDAVAANVVWIDPLVQRPGWWPRGDPGGWCIVFLGQLKAGLGPQQDEGAAKRKPQNTIKPLTRRNEAEGCPQS